MKRHLFKHLPESDPVSGYSQSIKVAESIIYQGLVVILCITLVGIGSMIALSASFPVKKEVHAAKKPTGRMQLSVNSTTTRYVVQSAYLEVRP